MRVLVTGATGFVGAWTARALEDDGHQVRLLVRDPARLKTSAAPLGVDCADVAVGDMCDEEVVRAAIAGCDAVVHAAASVALRRRHADVVCARNLLGTQTVLGAAVDQGLLRIVHVSSSSTLWSRERNVVDADQEPLGGPDAYSKSKADADRYARNLQHAGHPVAITYPCTVLGPPAGDHLGEAGEGIAAIFRFGAIPGRGAAFTIVDVRDVAAAHSALVGGKGRPGRYVLGAERLTGVEIAGRLSSLSGQRVRALPVPDGLVVGLGALMDRLGEHVPRALNEFSAAGMRYLTHAPPADSRRARTELGVVFRSVDETLRDVCGALVERNSGATPTARPDHFRRNHV